MREVREAWEARLPDDPDALFAELLALPEQELLSLLAVCVAATVGAVVSREDEVHAAALAQAVNLDMHDWWTPTAAGYFEHVSKARRNKQRVRCSHGCRTASRTRRRSSSAWQRAISSPWSSRSASARCSGTSIR
jgi:predicted DNA-binding transcriptional regulator YafY